MKTITKKIDPEWFDAIERGDKRYELRLADFDIETGDTLRLEECGGEGENRKPTGRVLEKKITHKRLVDLDQWIKDQPELLKNGMYILMWG